MLIVQTVMFLGIGIKLIVLVRSHSLSITQMKKINNSALKNVLQKPYAKIVGLLIGMTSSAWIQLVAGVVSALTSLFASDLHMIDYFLQCFGILIFAIFVLLLFNPLLEESNHSSATMVTTERDDQEGNEDSISKQQSTLSQSHHPPFSKEMLSLPESSSSPSIAMNTSPSSPNDLEMNEIAKV
ncbi:hypothetical protein C9374_003730 [Naegleria lovaniensis]|uniref:Uncharacterized protein n=1 Tax=Naegleria lovaniensis TaxID=51637 RepID=A0AA88KS79_NAELO|nr:uncharacterized protein C9374_003730 [Naegleria lovaniensis]KAG2393966.1 hypothetical protein C9374_003730 [Naegleria lovaniensis]